jgi:phospholipase C
MRLLLRILPFLPLVALASPAFAAPCALNPTNPSVTICTPANGATVTSPVNIVASTTDSSPVIAMAIYVDNVLATKQNVSEINASINMSQGKHYVVVQAWDQAGRIPKTPINITVGSSTNPPPTISFNASPTSIASGGSSTLTWSTSNATSVSIDNGIGGVATSGSKTVSPAATTTYTLTATGPGGTATARATVSVGTPSGSCAPSSAVPSINICSPANGSTVASPVHVQATPNSSRGVVAIAVYVDNNLAYKQNVTTLDTSINMSNGNHYVVVQFWDTAGAVTKASTNITVSSTAGAPTISFIASPTSITSGQSSTLTWSSTNATSVTIDNGVGTVQPNGAVTVSPSATTTYTATATSADGITATAQTTVTVTSTTGAPTVTLAANPTSITAGQSSTLTWSSTNASSVTIDNGIGTVNPSGSQAVTPATTTTYTITATGSGGTATATATINVAVSETCNPSSTVPSIQICTPLNGSTVASPVHIQAAPNTSRGVAAIAVYVDNALAYKQNVQTLDTSINMTNGNHYVVVQYWDNTGAVTKASVNITVSPDAGPTISFTANPGLISSGQSSTLSWTTSNASSVTIDNGIGAVPTSGSQSVSPTATTTYTLTATGNSGSATASTTVSVSGSSGDGGINKINHIIFALQENRSFDNYFGMMNQYRAMNGLPQDVDAFTLNSSGVPTNSNPNYARNGSVNVFHMISMCTQNLSPSWNESHVSANFSNPSSNTFLNDGFVWVAGHNARDTGEYDVNGLRAMGYYDYHDLPYYYFMASQFAMSDRWFSPAPANTNTNRHYMYAATSNGHAYPWSGAASTSPTIWDRLTAAGISWKVYVANFNSTVFYEFINAQKYGDHIFPIQKYFDDLAAGTLPQVATLETAGLNEHPENNIQAGAAFMASAINALMGSQYWKDSAFILSYDEFGGLYDHVHPQLTVSPDGVKPIDLKSGDIPGDFTRTGFRVPFFVVSPYARPHYVSHTPADHTAILKFIEKRFALPPLTARDSAQMDMTEFFDFNNPAWATPPSPPTQPQNAPCYYDHLP